MALAVHLRDAVSLAGRFPLLAGVTLDVDEGEIVHLAGANGAGKTSLLRAIAGLIPVSSGEAVVLGHDLRVDRLEVRREVGFVGHSSFLYDELTAEENLRFSLRALAVPSMASLRRSSAWVSPAAYRAPRQDGCRPASAAESRSRRSSPAVLGCGSSTSRMRASTPEEGACSTRSSARRASPGVTVVFASHELDRAGAIATERVEIAGGQVRRPRRAIGVASAHRSFRSRARRSTPVWRDALLVLGKDLRIERRARVATNQVLPFALAVLLLFGLALGPDRTTLEGVAAGLFWVTVLFASVLGVQRSFAVEAADDAADGLRISGLDPAGVFFGKAAALALQLLVLELVLAVLAAFLYGMPLSGAVLLVATCLVATVGLCSVGMLYGVLAIGTRFRETLLPLLLLPVSAPVLLGAVKAWQAALAGTPGSGVEWLELLGVFAVVYLAIGTVAFGPLLEDG